MLDLLSLIREAGMRLVGRFALPHSVSSPLETCYAPMASVMRMVIVTPVSPRVGRTSRLRSYRIANPLSLVLLSRSSPTLPGW